MIKYRFVSIVPFCIKPFSIELFSIVLLLSLSVLSASSFSAEKLDRQKIVARHMIVNPPDEVQIPIGNGSFCFNTDRTGLQTFTGCILSDWSWHSVPLPKGVKIEDVPATGTFQQGRNKGPDIFGEKDKANILQWLRENPHRTNLGRVRFVRSNGSSINESEIKVCSRKLDLWTGLNSTVFTLDGDNISVQTVVPNSDAVCVSVQGGKDKLNLNVAIDFPYCNGKEGAYNKNPMITCCDWKGDFTPNATNHTTTVIIHDKHEQDGQHGQDKQHEQYEQYEQHDMTLRRQADDFVYFVTIKAENALLLPPNETEKHRVLLVPQKNDFTFSISFREDKASNAIPNNSLSFDTAVKQSKERWIQYWNSGAAIDLSGSSDPRWKELERRIVLSQFQMGTNSTGRFPCPETGLLGIDPWRGRYHLEMAWWHLAHYYLWNRDRYAVTAVDCYQFLKDPARQLARQLGYKGYQWQKCVASDDARTQPWSGNQVLLWKEPHPIFFAELEYRNHPTKKTLEKWADIVEGTATYMADYPVPDEKGILHLDPVMPPSEQGVTKDTVFDLAYWRLGLDWANRWRERLGQPRNADWDAVRQKLAPLPVNSEGLFVHSAEWFDTYTKRNWEHPDPIGVLGMLPPIQGVDPAIAKKTVATVMRKWQWNRCWGWDFPWMAMAAVRTGQPEIAIEILLSSSPRNAYDARGVNIGGPCPYLPGNGGLLYVIAMMAAGWDGCPNENAPGFPKNGQWKVKYEGFSKAP